MSSPYICRATSVGLPRHASKVKLGSMTLFRPEVHQAQAA
ncbi:hypothetical protein MIZ03_1190 [Rhodoferax lithotrophicus]|uniref:Uncharacterized protein n=1 Tax=Rhodoferax lithotrophicus TaxID=2798804 RepID=A0ABM7MJ60_9BURK|nr:hypothetical protein MIZ03_1190 [Rhodoferax sp. MIZ03]